MLTQLATPCTDSVLVYYHAIFVLISCFNLVLFGYMPPVNPYIIYSFNKFQNSKLRTPQFIKVHASTRPIVLHYKTYTTDNSLYLPKYKSLQDIYIHQKLYMVIFIFISFCLKEMQIEKALSCMSA